MNGAEILKVIAAGGAKEPTKEQLEKHLNKLKKLKKKIAPSSFSTRKTRKLCRTIQRNGNDILPHKDHFPSDVSSMVFGMKNR